MKKRKQQKEIDKAISNLMKYGEQAPWSERQQQFFTEMLMGAADKVDVSVDELGQTLEDQGYMGMAFGYLFELFSTCYWDNEDFCMIDDYLKRRGWREASHAKRYLQALAKSEAKLWEVTDVDSGHWVDVRPAGTKSKSVRVYERSGSQSLNRWDCIAARVVSLDGKYSFSGGILPFSSGQAQEMPEFQKRIYERAIDTLKKFRSEESECQWSDKEIEAMATEEIEQYFENILFYFWACRTYMSLSRPMPTMVNRDGHHLQLSKIKFPIEAKDRITIEKRLSDDPHLDFNNDTKEWVWLNCEKDNIKGVGATVLGQLSITDEHLTATVNSIERAESVKGFLKTLFGEMLGTPLSVHENLQSMLENYSPKENLAGEILDAPELITASLDQHYRKILDEPIPALNNQTPKECSQKESQHAILIQWLKGLENTTASASQMSHYDFKWMWEKLGLECTDVDE